MNAEEAPNVLGSWREGLSATIPKKVSCKFLPRSFAESVFQEGLFCLSPARCLRARVTLWNYHSGWCRDHMRCSRQRLINLRDAGLHDAVQPRLRLIRLNAKLAQPQ